MARTLLSRVAVAAIVGVFLLISAAVALAFKPKAGNWTGTTSQTLPVTGSTLIFQVASGGVDVLNFSPTFDGTCTKPGSPNVTSPVITTDAGRNVPINKKNKFYAQAKNGRLRSGTTTVGSSKDQVHGKFTSHKKAKGTYTVTFQFNNSAPAQLAGVAGYSCKTGVVTWSASFS